MSKIISLAQRQLTKYYSDQKFTDHDHKVLAFNRATNYGLKAAETIVNNFIATYGEESANKLLEVLKNKGFVDKKVKIKEVA